MESPQLAEPIENRKIKSGQTKEVLAKLTKDAVKLLPKLSDIEKIETLTRQKRPFSPVLSDDRQNKNAKVNEKVESEIPIQEHANLTPENTPIIILKEVK
jgi:hypothetical protein